MARRVRIVGSYGRAGGSVADALSAADGWEVLAGLHRGDDLTDAAAGTDFLVLAVPDRAVATVAAATTPVASTVVVHLAGSLTLEPLAPHPRRASLHPLVPLPNRDVGRRRLRGCWMALAGDAAVAELADALGGHGFHVDERHRAAYHAAGAVASNHLTALLGQVQRIAQGIGVPFDAYVALARAALDDIAAHGPAAALTGAVVRGDWETVARHLDALPAGEHATYRAMMRETARLAGRELPADL